MMRHGVRWAILVCALGWASACPASSNKDPASGGSTRTTATGGDPVNMATGEYYFLRPLVDLGGPMPLGFSLYYGSQTTFKQFPAAIHDGLPAKFAHNHRQSLRISFNDAQVDNGLGNAINFFKSSGWDWTSWGVAFVERWDYQLHAGTNNAYWYFLDPETERVTVFKTSATTSRAFPICVFDRSGNSWTYTYAADPRERGPDAVTDGLGRALQFGYAPVNGTNYLASVTDQGGRQWSFVYESGPPDNTGAVTLRTIVQPDGATIRFAWAGSSRLAAERLPAGNTPLTNAYSGASSVVTNQTDALGNRTVFVQQSAVSGLTQFTAEQPDGTLRAFTSQNEGRAIRWIADEEGRVASFDTLKPFGMAEDIFTNIVDRAGRSVKVDAHEAGGFASGHPSRATDPRGLSFTFHYATNSRTFTNPETGETVAFTFSDLIRIGYPDGTSDGFGRDAAGRIVAWTNRAGNAAAYAYDARGSLVAVTNPAGGVATFGWDTSVVLRAWSDGDTGVWSNEVDALFRVSAVRSPDGARSTFAFDALDRVTNAVDGAGMATTFSYDANGNLAQRVAAAGTAEARTNRWVHDALDRPVEQVDALGGTTRAGYSWWGGITNVTFADGASLVLQYSPAQFVRRVLDEAGFAAHVDLDPEGIPTGFLSPAGRRVEILNDAAGYPVGIVDPMSNTWRVARDASQRITNVTDRLGRSVAIRRDPAGRVMEVAVPVIGSALYEVNGLGLPTNAVDPRGGAWTFEWTPAGRLAGRRDAEGRLWSYGYDTNGRPRSTLFPDGVSMVESRDSAGRVTNRVYSTGLSFSFRRDAAGRVREAAGGIPVTLDYDRRDAITNCTVGGLNLGAAYDVRGRIASLSYGGLLSVAYQYDARGLVTQVWDSAGGARIGLGYDADRLLVRITRANGVHTEVARDANGRITNLTHTGRGSIRIEYDRNDRILRLLQDLPAEVGALLGDEIREWTFDRSHRIDAVGFAYDARGRLVVDPQRGYAWDASDALTGLTNASVAASFAYTALGDLFRRVAAGVTNEYLTHPALPLRPVVVERRNGANLRCYVHTPGGRLLYSVDVATSAPRFFHFNHLGTTLFLTDAAGAVSDSYGYTAYGRVVRHNGPDDQPFTWLGESGVRQERDTSLYHMRARWYDSLTGRFLSPDPLWMDLLTDPLQINPHQYVRGDPVQLTDPTGEEPSGGVIMPGPGTKSGVDATWLQQFAPELRTGGEHYGDPAFGGVPLKDDGRAGLTVVQTPSMSPPYLPLSSVPATLGQTHSKWGAKTDYGKPKVRICTPVPWDTRKRRPDGKIEVTHNTIEDLIEQEQGCCGNALVDRDEFAAKRGYVIVNSLLRRDSHGTQRLVRGFPSVLVAVVAAWLAVRLGLAAADMRRRRTRR